MMQHYCMMHNHFSSQFFVATLNYYDYLLKEKKSIFQEELILILTKLSLIFLLLLKTVEQKPTEGLEKRQLFEFSLNRYYLKLLCYPVRETFKQLRSLPTIECIILLIANLPKV